MSFLAPSDFVGIVEQSTNEFTEDKMQSYIDRYEPLFLRSLMGASMYDEFLADLDTAPLITPSSIPTDPKFTIIFEQFHLDDGNTNGCQHNSDGMVQMLKFFVMFQYSVDNQFDFAMTGATKNSFSNSEIAQLNQTNAIDNYNEGVKTFHAIQWYICDNPVPYDYDNYNGQKKEFMTWL